MKIIITETQFKIIKILNENTQIGTVLPEEDIYTYVQKLHTRKDDFWDGDLGDRIESFPYYKLKLIPINEINLDEWELDEDKIQDYIQKLKENNGEYPPIVLGYKESGWGYSIIDGTHRANVLKKIGVLSIKAWVGIED